MIEEVDHSEIESLKADKRHKELLTILKGLPALIAAILEPQLRSDSPTDKELLASVQKYNLTLEGLAAKVQAVSQSKPQVTVDLKSVVSAIEELSKEVRKVNAPKAEKPAEYELSILRNPAGFIQSVNAKIKNK